VIERNRTVGMPLFPSSRGGVAARSRKAAKPHFDAQTGWSEMFLTTPAAPTLRMPSAISFQVASTPPLEEGNSSDSHEESPFVRHKILSICATICGLILSGVFSGSTFAADVDHGKELFSACAACHTEKPDASGPSLKGVVGRKSAALEDFRYSNAMKRANLTWDEANLREYLRDPQAKVKGTRMPFSGFANPTDVDDIVAYLVTLK
jgi:cytochrome c